MLLRIESLKEKKLVGQRVRMSSASNQTIALWQQFGPRLKEVRHRPNPLRYAMQVYDQVIDVRTYSPDILFDMWAAVETERLEELPDGMEGYDLEGGLYAVFLHRGLPSDFPKTWQYIFGSWLPSSGYVLDNRPHLQLMGETYHPNDPTAEEEVWIPIRQK